ncbi:Lysophospholipase, alpha-beta hydrolase superfamily [Ruminococcaceae bacterium YRB3002]|nr:Lysophospholipase, alpha-beta hydrolase superfamily [Ruminococcaceae bacterium YRB3002]
MNINYEYNSPRKKPKGSLLTRLALVFSVLSAVIIVIIVLTVTSANRLMNIERNYASNVPSNILPSYSNCSFSSADGQTTLSGWFFKTKNPVTTIIVVHDTGSNRLPFGVTMIDMIEDWLDSGYNVFLFDQRNSGDSAGDISGYGYIEWQDVLGAISIVRQISVTTDVVLYGIGTGCTSSVIAYNNLPPADVTEAQLKSYSQDIRELGFTRGYVSGIIFDSPAKNSDDYIKPVVRNKEFLGFITQNFVPYAIRISAGESNINLAAEIARLPIPVCIIYGGHDTFIGADKINQIINERNRLSSSLTESKMISGAGYLEEYSINSGEYIGAVSKYLDTFFAREN